MRKGTKILTGALVATSAAVLIGVGYATWTIAGNDETKDSNVEVNVGDIDDNRFTLTVTDTEKAKLNFDSSNEQLSFTVKYNIKPTDTSKEAADVVGAITWNLTAKNDKGTITLTDYIGKGKPLTGETEGTINPVSEDGDITVSFKWGDNLDAATLLKDEPKNNPQHILDHGSDDQKTAAIEDLKTLQGLNGTTFTLTVTATPKGAAKAQE